MWSGGARNYLEIVISLLELFDFQAMCIYYFDKIHINFKKSKFSGHADYNSFENILPLVLTQAFLSLPTLTKHAKFAEQISLRKKKCYILLSFKSSLLPKAIVVSVELC